MYANLIQHYKAKANMHALSPCKKSMNIMGQTDRYKAKRRWARPHAELRVCAEVFPFLWGIEDFTPRKHFKFLTVKQLFFCVQFPVFSFTRNLSANIHQPAQVQLTVIVRVCLSCHEIHLSPARRWARLHNRISIKHLNCRSVKKDGLDLIYPC
jgi:hypothetical protein